MDQNPYETPKESADLKPAAHPLKTDQESLRRSGGALIGFGMVFGIITSLILEPRTARTGPVVGLVLIVLGVALVSSRFAKRHP